MSDLPADELRLSLYWTQEAKGILRAEIERRGVTYKKLAKLMQAANLNETERSLANKISRGAFSFAFFLQVMRVLGVQNVSLAPAEQDAPERHSGQASKPN